MEFTNLEMVLLLLAAMLSIFFFRRQFIRYQRNRVLLTTFNKIAEAQGLQASKQDVFSDKILALDTARKVLVYLDYFNLKDATLLDLEDLKDCRLTVRSLFVRLDLEFFNPCKARVSLVFYRRFLDPAHMRRSLTDRAKRWNELLLETVKSSREFEYGISG